MLRLSVRSTILPLVAAALLGACADPSAPAPRVPRRSARRRCGRRPRPAPTTNSFAGWLWVCPDTPVGGTAGFYFSWKITDNATNVVVGQGTVMNASAQQCLNLGNVSTTVHGALYRDGQGRSGHAVPRHRDHRRLREQLPRHPADPHGRIFPRTASARSSPTTSAWSSRSTTSRRIPRRRSNGRTAPKRSDRGAGVPVRGASAFEFSGT